MIQANIVQDAQNIVADKESDTKHLQIICVWQKGADALIEQYRQLKLPKSDKLDVLVVTKEELMKKFKATVQEFEPTSRQINTVCKNIGSIVKDKQVHLYIDECWVTAPKKYSAHVTQVSLLTYASQNYHKYYP